MVHFEDYLQQYVENVGVTDNNKQILTSINAQCKKGTALTDRQYALVKAKLIEQTAMEFDADAVLRIPLRKIDRSKYITLVQYPGDMVYDSHKKNWQWIKIRFPFAKKTIIDLETVAFKHRKVYMHESGSHEHYFKLNEIVLRDIINVFAKKEFKIDPALTDLYNQIIEIEQTPSDYIPGVWNGEFTNLNIKDNINDYTPFQLIDRKKQLGLDYVSGEVPSGLTGEICNRTDTHITVNPASYSLDKIVASIHQLERFPLLVLLDAGSELDQISRLYNSFKYIIKDSEQTVLCRVDGSKEYNFNDFIKERKLNNWLDNNTKIVYISKNKLPKLLLKEKFIPQSTLQLTSVRSNNFVSAYVDDLCDLVIAHDTEKSFFWRPASAYM